MTAGWRPGPDDRQRHGNRGVVRPPVQPSDLATSVTRRRRRSAKIRGSRWPETDLAELGAGPHRPGRSRMLGRRERELRTPGACDPVVGDVRIGIAKPGEGNAFALGVPNYRRRQAAEDSGPSADEDRVGYVVPNRGSRRSGRRSERLGQHSAEPQHRPDPSAGPAPAVAHAGVEFGRVVSRRPC